MRIRMERTPRHPRAEVACPPLGWRAVGRRVFLAVLSTALSGAGAVYTVLYWRKTGEPEIGLTAAILIGVAVVSVLWLTHLLNAARNPITFKIANGELIVIRPFLFTRRHRRLRTEDVQAVTVATDRDVSDGRLPTGRLRIRRKFRLPVRVAGRRTLHELDRVAEELRAVLRV